MIFVKTFVLKHSNDFLTPEALQTYSPKFLHILENIQDPEHQGLHLVYSQFRTSEGIGLLTLVLNKNGFTQFKINKNSFGIWEINIPEEEQGKPTYGLYTGTESVEEKEIIRLIYNGEWDDIPDSISNVLKSNPMGNVEQYVWELVEKRRKEKMKSDSQLQPQTFFNKE